jgi:hypothetical protein
MGKVHDVIMDIVVLGDRIHLLIEVERFDVNTPEPVGTAGFEETTRTKAFILVDLEPE